MTRLIFLILLICTTEFAFSQTDYRKGYVVTNTGDTLFGLVSYRDGQKAYKRCNFKSSQAQSPVIYEPGSIVGYGFQNDKVFQSREISLKGEPSKVVFLEVLVKGRVSLYKFERALFVEKEGIPLQQLISETKELSIDGRTVFQETHQYIGTLNIALFDCPEISKSIPDVKLNEKALTNLIRDYNLCKGNSSIIYKAKKPWSRATIGLTGGVNISHINFETKTTNFSFPQLDGVFKVYKGPMIGVSFDVLSPRLNERISLHGDIFYLSSKYYRYSTSQPYVTIERDYVSIKLQQLKIPLSIRYTFPTTRFIPYFNIGVSGTFTLRADAQWIQETELNHIVETYKYDALDINKNQLGVWAGCGISKSISGKLATFVEVRYEQTQGISQNTTFKQADLVSKITNIQLLIGIRIK